MRRSPVYVKWLDHAGGADAREIQAARDLTPVIRETVAWLIKRTRRRIVVAADLYRIESVMAEYAYVIDRRCIVELVLLARDTRKCKRFKQDLTKV